MDWNTEEVGVCVVVYACLNGRILNAGIKLFLPAPLYDFIQWKSLIDY